MKTYLCILATLLSLLAATATDAAMTIKLGVVTKPGSAQNIVAEKFKGLVENESKGDITVKIFHSSSIGNETEILQQIQMNSVQMGIITSGPFDTFNPIVRVIDYPFLFKDNQQADMILDGPLGNEILKDLEVSGFKGLCFSENGFRNLTNSRRPVKGPDDTKGLKIRVMSSPMHNAIWQALGANPTPMPWPIYTELEQRVVDGQENPLWVLVEYKLWEVQKYLTMTHHVYSPHIDVASLVWWKTLDANTQTVLQRAMRTAALAQRQENRDGDAQRLQLLKEKGFIIENSPDIDGMRAKVAGLKDMDIYQDPKVKVMLEKMLAAVQ
jgi:tripartite ATP-independent transporter DctP family solute receptor